MRKLDVYWLWFGEEYEAIIINQIREIDVNFLTLKNEIFCETDLMDMVRIRLMDIAVEIYTNEPTRSYTEEHYDCWIRLNDIALALCYSILADLSEEVQTELENRLEIARNEMYEYYI